MSFITFLNEKIEAKVAEEKITNKQKYKIRFHLGESHSEAAADEIEYIDVDDDEDGVVIVTVEFADRNIKKFRAEYYADLLDIDFSDAKFSRGKLIAKLDDEDGDIAKKVKKFAKDNGISCG